MNTQDQVTVGKVPRCMSHSCRGWPLKMLENMCKIDVYATITKLTYCTGKAVGFNRETEGRFYFSLQIDFQVFIEGHGRVFPI